MAGARKPKISKKSVVEATNESSSKVPVKRVRASDFVGGKKKQKVCKTRPTKTTSVDEKDGENVVSKLLSDVANLGAENSELDSDQESDIEALRDAILEAQEADEKDDSDQKSLADSDEEVGSDVESEKSGSPSDENDAKDASESDDSDVDMDNHQLDLEKLKESDPKFYQYLQENDAELLDFGQSDGEDASDGDSDEGNESEEERMAAEEAGLEATPARKEKEKSVKLVDMAYLRNLESELDKRRTALKASQDLLRLFRSGRELAVSNEIVTKTKKKAAKAKKQSKRKSSATAETEDVKDADGLEFEDFGDDAAFDAGKVRFASAKAYQKAMNMAIVGIQKTLDDLLGKPDPKAPTKVAQEWSPRTHKRWSNLESMFKGFVYHITALTEHMKDARTLRFLLKRLELLAPYTKETPALTRKLVNLALPLWSSSDRDISQTTKLRAFFLLYSLASETENCEIVLRKVCASYLKNISSTCNSRTLPSILFSVNCIVELFGIDMGASYSVAFTSLRELAVILRTVLTCKGQDMKTEIDKLYNWKIINAIRLWSTVLGRYGGEDELESLIYPFVQVSLGILRLPTNPKCYPLRLQVCGFVTDMTSQTGVFVPVPPHLLNILRCAELKTIPKRGAIRPLDWRALLRVEDEVVATKPYLGGVIRGVVFELAKYFASISKHVSFPEIAHSTTVELQKVAKELRVTEWKRDIIDLRDSLRKTGTMIAEARAKSGLGPRDAIGQNKMGESVGGISEETKTPIQRLYELEQKRKVREEKMREESTRCKK